jgi:DNA mismatch repair ATPase MutS
LSKGGGIVDITRWVKKFTSMGHKVVIMDQTNSTKAKAGQPVGRDVKRVFTPGTLGDIWSSDSSNYLVAIKVFTTFCILPVYLIIECRKVVM